MKPSYFLIPVLTTSGFLFLWRAVDYLTTWLATTPFVQCGCLVAWK
jgi:hypothetical protein